MSCCRTLRTELLRTAVALDFLERKADAWKDMPDGWDASSRKKFWESLTGNSKHKVTACIKAMDGKVEDPGAFCASLADRVMGKEWRSK